MESLVIYVMEMLSFINLGKSQESWKENIKDIETYLQTNLSKVQETVLDALSELFRKGAYSEQYAIPPHSFLGKFYLIRDVLPNAHRSGLFAGAVLSWTCYRGWVSTRSDGCIYLTQEGFTELLSSYKEQVRPEPKEQPSMSFKTSGIYALRSASHVSQIGDGEHLDHNLEFMQIDSSVGYRIDATILDEEDWKIEPPEEEEIETIQDVWNNYQKELTYESYTSHIPDRIRECIGMTVYPTWIHDKRGRETIQEDALNYVGNKLLRASVRLADEYETIDPSEIF